MASNIIDGILDQIDIIEMRLNKLKTTFDRIDIVVTTS